MADGRRRRSFRRVLVTWGLWTALLWSIIGVLLAPVVPGAWLGVLALAVLGATPLVALVRGFGRRVYPSAAMRVLVIRPFWYLQLLLPLLAALGLLGLIVGLPFGAAGRAGRWAMAFGVVLFGVTMLFGYFGSRRLVVRRRELELAALPQALDGLRIVQISDLHVGPHTSRRFLARIARAVDDADADVLAITGDQVDDFAQDVEHFAAAFGTLRARLGAFVVPGNHDVYAGWREVRQRLEALPVRVLVNEAAPLTRNGTRFWIAGTGDPAGHYWSRDGGAEAMPDPERTLSAVPPGEFVLVLAHNPVLWPALAERGVPLTLSGHTHHGQLAIPSLGWSLVSPFVEHAMGLYEKGGAVLYVHPGTNYWGIPFRIGAPPEVTVITVRRRPSVPRAPSAARCSCGSPVPLTIERASPSVSRAPGNPGVLQRREPPRRCRGGSWYRASRPEGALEAPIGDRWVTCLRLRPSPLTRRAWRPPSESAPGFRSVGSRLVSSGPERKLTLSIG